LIDKKKEIFVPEKRSIFRELKKLFLSDYKNRKASLFKLAGEYE